MRLLIDVVVTIAGTKWRKINRHEAVLRSRAVAAATSVP